MFIPQLISSCISVVFQQHQSNWHLLIIFWLFRPCFSPICSALSYFLIFLFKNVKFPRYVRPVLLTYMLPVASQHCWLNNAVTTRLSLLNNVVQPTTLFTIVSDVVQYWWGNKGGSRLLKQEETILIEQDCSLLSSLLLYLVNKL